MPTAPKPRATPTTSGRWRWRWPPPKSRRSASSSFLRLCSAPSPRPPPSRRDILPCNPSGTDILACPERSRRVCRGTGRNACPPIAWGSQSRRRRLLRLCGRSGGCGRGRGRGWPVAQVGPVAHDLAGLANDGLVEGVDDGLGFRAAEGLFQHLVEGGDRKSVV